ncbi:MAG: phosphatidate cytidylyltransferase [Rhodocyclaceae bacterium]|nr:phosphatidate cytidylyltransferase [Rhodocyclaceae bacterium]
MLRTRVITALCLLAAFLVVLLLLPRPAAAAAFGLVAVLAAWEWAGLMKIDAAGRVIFAGVVAVCCLAAYHQAESVFPMLWWLSAGFWVAVAPFWLIRGWPLSANDLMGYGTGWVLIVPTWAALVGLHGRGPGYLFGAMAAVWIADIAAYFAGRALGRHKLAPSISPGKTWEGAAGGAVGVLAYGAVVAILFARGIPGDPGELAVGALLLVLLTAVSIEGDLFESLVKRQAGVKDSSGLLPGHGGILDRIDSQTSALPLVALFLHAMIR